MSMVFSYMFRLLEGNFAFYLNWAALRRLFCGGCRHVMLRIEFRGRFTSNEVFSVIWEILKTFPVYFFLLVLHYYLL